MFSGKHTHSKLLGWERDKLVIAAFSHVIFSIWLTTLMSFTAAAASSPSRVSLLTWSDNPEKGKRNFKKS